MYLFSKNDFINFYDQLYPNKTEQRHLIEKDYFTDYTAYNEVNEYISHLLNLNAGICSCGTCSSCCQIKIAKKVAMEIFEMTPRYKIQRVDTNGALIVYPGLHVRLKDLALKKLGGAVSFGL